MHYNFTQALNGTSYSDVFHELVDKYISCGDCYDDEKYSKSYNYYKQITYLFSKDFSSEEMLDLYGQLSIYKMSQEVPYIIMTAEMYALKNLLLSKMVSNGGSAYILDLITLFKEINNRVASVYLETYVDSLVSINNVRLGSLSEIIEKSIIKYYEAHLNWLSQLAKDIKAFNKKDFVELDDTMCEFGQWLHDKAKNLIQNNSKFNSLNSLHKSLHLFATKIFDQLEYKEHHVLISYLEKCELISLSIGTELALIDNIQINNRVTKDALTGAINRNGLQNIFETQYELSFATSNSFILAMCDLDYFKKINDTYGHVAGDKILKLFVDTAKEITRNSDIIIRYGGEEFVLILPALKKDIGIRVLNNIRTAFEEKTLQFEGEEIKATLSMGALLVTPENSYKEKFFDEYIMIADKILYTAKHNGRNRVEML